MGLQEDLGRLRHPLPRFYAISCIGALLVVALLLAERDGGCFVLLPVLLGVAGLATRARIVPLLVLGLVVALVLVRNQGYDLGTFLYKWVFPWTRVRGYASSEQPSVALDALLALALLVYFQGQYRLYALLGSALPSEGRSLAERRKPVPREPGEESAAEGLSSLGTLAATVVVAAFTWTVVYHTEPPLETSRDTWRALLLVWVLATALIVTTTVARVLFWRAAPPEVHAQYLQETLWRETRGEQGRINRWLTAARLKAQKRREK